MAEEGLELYLCHQCGGIVPITLSLLGNITCSICNSGFVQEFTNPTQIRSILSDDLQDYDADIILNITNDPLSTSIGSESSEVSSIGMADVERRDEGGSSDFVFEDYDDNGLSIPSSTNTGDYFNGPGFQEFIEQLPEIEPICCGPPPASRTAVQRLPDIVVNEQMLKSDAAQCTVCQEDFERGVKVKKMPCNHLYHDYCILPWLELHNSCPVCRYELPTDDPNYENQTSNTSRNPHGSDITNRSSRGPMWWFTLSVIPFVAWIVVKCRRL